MRYPSGRFRGEERSAEDETNKEHSGHHQPDDPVIARRRHAAHLLGQKLLVVPIHGDLSTFSASIELATARASSRLGAESASELNGADSSVIVIQANETLGRPVSFNRMIDDIGIAIAGLAALCVLYWLFVVEPRTSVHSDH